MKICYWPDGTWCSDERLEHYGHMSDDYRTFDVEDYDYDAVDHEVRRRVDEEGKKFCQVMNAIRYGDDLRTLRNEILMFMSGKFDEFNKRHGVSVRGVEARFIECTQLSDEDGVYRIVDVEINVAA